MLQKTEQRCQGECAGVGQILHLRGSKIVPYCSDYMKVVGGSVATHNVITAHNGRSITLFM